MKTLLLAFFVALLYSPSVGYAAEEYQHVFPKVKIQYPIFLQIFSEYAKEQKMKPLQPNHLRFFIQPLGIIDSAFDVDLASGAFIRYQGTHDKDGIKNGKLNEKDLGTLTNLVKSKSFQNLPGQESKALGLDGSNYFIEVELQERYLWRLRWEPDELSIKKIAKLLKQTSTTKPLNDGE